MGRTKRSAIDLLLQEARAIELLANEIYVPIERTEEYWRLSADLITLVIEIEELRLAQPDIDGDHPTLFTLRHRLRAIAVHLAELSRE